MFCDQGKIKLEISNKNVSTNSPNILKSSNQSFKEEFIKEIKKKHFEINDN